MNLQDPRTIARVFGWLMVITFVTSIPASIPLRPGTGYPRPHHRVRALTPPLAWHWAPPSKVP